MQSSEPTKQSICKALYVCHNSHSSKSERDSADTYLQSIKTSPNGLKLSINLFTNTMEPPVLFYCLHVMEHSIDKRWHELDTQSMSTLNQLFLSFLSQVCSKDNLFKNIPSHIRSKIAQILVKLMQRQYLQSWDTFFTDLLQILQQSNDGCNVSGVWDMFYRILQDLNWSIHENRNVSQDQLTLNNKIKDKMRANDMGQIVQMWYLFLSNYSKYDCKLCQQCLVTMDKYISWIEIAYISHTRFLTILYSFLEINSFQNESVDCLYEIVVKRMDYTHKMELIQNIKILPIITKMDINNSQYSVNDKLLFAESICALIEGIGIEMIGCVKDSVNNAQFTLFQCYDLALKYFSHPSFKINQECVAFLCKFWNLIKRQNDKVKNDGMSERQQTLFNKTLFLVSNNQCYPNDYDINAPDESEGEFDYYRKEKLDQLITAMTRCYPKYMLHLVGTHFSKTCQTIDGKNKNELRWQNIESDLHLIYKICEGFSLNRNIDELIRNNSQFRDLFEYSLKVDICNKYRNNIKVLLKYFEIIYRYNVFFETNPNYIGQVLQLLVLCIQNSQSNNTLRAQSAYVLQKLIRALYAFKCEKVNAVLLRFMDTLIQSLGTCLTVYIQQKRAMEIVQQFDGEDIKNICGVLGQLILLPNHENKHKLFENCNRICSIFVAELKHYICHSNEWMDINRDLIAQIMGEYISCVQCFFKPFGFVSNENISNECIKKVLLECTEIVIKSYASVPNCDELRQISISFVHTMVYILKNEIISQLESALKLYIEYMNGNNCVFTLQIITNITVSLRQSIVHILDNMFYSLFDRVLSIINEFENVDTVSVGNGHNICNKNDITKHLYLFLLKCFQSDCFKLFLSNKNGRHFERVIQFILDGCVISANNSDHSMYKTCFTILKEMLSAMGNTHPSMKDLFCNKVMKVSFEFGVSPYFNEKKPEFNTTLKYAIFGIHGLMFKVFGNEEITNCMGRYLVTQLGLDTNTAKKYCDLCIKGNQQRKLKQIVLSLRSLAINQNQTNNGSNNDYQTHQL